MSADWAAICDKVTGLFWLDQETAEQIRHLLRTSGDFQKFMSAVEFVLRSGNGSLPYSNPLIQKLWEHLRTLKPVAELVPKPPLLSDVDPALLGTMLGFADLQPDPEVVLRTRDSVFMRIVSALLNIGAVSAELFVAEDLERLHELQEQNGWLINSLVNLADRPDYDVQVGTIDAQLDDPKMTEPELIATVEPSLLHIALKLRQEEREEWRGLFRGNGKVPIAAIPREAIQLFGAIGQNWPTGQSLTISNLNSLRQNLPDMT